jgi:hypothetical protein
MDTEGKLFQLSGMEPMMTGDGDYSLIVDLPNIKSLDGINGIRLKQLPGVLTRHRQLSAKLFLQSMVVMIHSTELRLRLNLMNL